jgi:hypothetical protein
VKRILLIALLLVLVLSSLGAGKAKKPAKKKPPPCAPDLAHCPDEGCGRRFDVHLNLQKNIPTSNKAPADRDYSFLAGLPKKVKDYKIGDTREKLVDFGEGKMIRVMAFAVDVRKGSPEACNCYRTSAAETDNHIVLVSPELIRPSLRGERNSQTAEFTPRVRLDHPNFNRAKLRALIRAAPRKALLVRVTGLQMYDSEHALGPFKVKRKNDWEIHPVFRLEFCPTGKKCTATGKDNWVDIEQ